MLLTSKDANKLLKQLSSELDSLKRQEASCLFSESSSLLNCFSNLFASLLVSNIQIPLSYFYSMIESADSLRISNPNS